MPWSLFYETEHSIRHEMNAIGLEPFSSAASILQLYLDELKECLSADPSRKWGMVARLKLSNVLKMLEQYTKDLTLVRVGASPDRTKRTKLLTSSDFETRQVPAAELPHGGRSSTRWVSSAPKGWAGTVRSAAVLFGTPVSHRCQHSQCAVAVSLQGPGRRGLRSDSRR